MPHPQGDEPPPTPKALLELMQLASPALPVGGFSYSEGLEAAVEAGLVSNEVQAGDWLLDQLGLSLARADLPVLAQAVPAWQAHDMARIRSLNDWVFSLSHDLLLHIFKLEIELAVLRGVPAVASTQIPSGSVVAFPAERH